MKIHEARKFINRQAERHQQGTLFRGRFDRVDAMLAELDQARRTLANVTELHIPAGCVLVVDGDVARVEARER